MDRHAAGRPRPAREKPFRVLDILSSGLRGLTRDSAFKSSLRVLLCAPVLLPTAGFSEQACKLSESVVSISQPGAPQAASELHVAPFGLESRDVDGVLHIDLRNDGPTQPIELCASPHLSDRKDSSGGVSIAFAQTDKGKPSDFKATRFCMPPPADWQVAQTMSFDVYIRSSSDSIPLSGFILFEAKANVTETLPAQGATTKPAGTNQPANGQSPSPKTVDCVSHAKPLSRPVILLPSKTTCWLGLPLIGGLIAAVLYLVISLLWSRKSLRKPMGGPQWGFGTSFATNFTVGGGLLSLALGGSLVTDSLHYLTKTHYLFLSLLFAALLLIAPAFFTFFATQQKFTSPSGPPTIAAVGWVWLYIVTSTLMVGAVVGQLLTVGLVMAEIEYRGYLGCGVLTFIELLIAIACIGAFVCALLVAPRYLKQQTDVQQTLVPGLKSLNERYKDLRQNVAGFAPIEADQSLIDHLINREEVPPRWTMF